MAKTLVCAQTHRWAESVENQRFAYAKTKTQISFAVTAKLISAFVFAIWIVQYLFFLNTKFQATSHFQWLYSRGCVRPGQNPDYWFSHVAAQIIRTRKIPNLHVTLNVSAQWKMSLRSTPPPACLLLTFIRRWFFFFCNFYFMLFKVGVSCRYSYAIDSSLNVSCSGSNISVGEERAMFLLSFYRFLLPLGAWDRLCYFIVVLPCYWAKVRKKNI